jgi:hypothetical protein
LEEREIRYGFLWLKRRYVNRRCYQCGHCWLDAWTEAEERADLEENRL